MDLHEIVTDRYVKDPETWNNYRLEMTPEGFRAIDQTADTFHHGMLVRGE